MHAYVVVGTIHLKLNCIYLYCLDCMCYIGIHIIIVSDCCNIFLCGAIVNLKLLCEIVTFS